ncbi:hypothetical protein BXY82_2959 [Gelidibacter sediminis]|uniref:Uncharacterized protein n=1 Tax=Gelidibacter sediminis TaxID=1608710 RepID=A0A4R7PJ30_9FLAO|nr:hypothetical protein BXY82_2959 [Gelidibacter sediminis]
MNALSASISILIAYFDWRNLSLGGSIHSRKADSDCLNFKHS